MGAQTVATPPTIQQPMLRKIYGILYFQQNILGIFNKNNPTTDVAENSLKSQILNAPWVLPNYHKSNNRCCGMLLGIC